MKHRHFLHRIDNQKLVEAIAAAEKRTSVDVLVFVSRKTVEDPVEQAGKYFHKLHRGQSEGLLIFVAPKSQKFAVIGSKAVHETCGQKLWDDLREILQKHFAREHFTEGLVKAVEEAGLVLSRDFPRRPL